MINPEKWLQTLKSNKKDITSITETNPQIWVNTIPKKNSSRLFKKYFFISSFFIIGLIFVTVIKNQTRNLEKELDNLRASVSNLKLNIHYATLDHEVITSPDNISNLASKHLDLNFIVLKNSQIKNLEDIHKERSIEANDIKKNIKTHLAKKIIENKNKIKNYQQMYSNPEQIPAHIKEEISGKINTAKNNIEASYTDPKKIITSARTQKWAAIQVVKAFLGIPIVPGK